MWPLLIFRSYSLRKFIHFQLSINHNKNINSKQWNISDRKWPRTTISAGTLRHRVSKKSQTDAVRRGIVGDTDTRRTSTEVRRCDVSSWPVNFSWAATRLTQSSACVHLFVDLLQHTFPLHCCCLFSSDIWNNVLQLLASLLCQLQLIQLLTSVVRAATLQIRIHEPTIA